MSQLNQPVNVLRWVLLLDIVDNFALPIGQHALSGTRRTNASIYQGNLEAKAPPDCGCVSGQYHMQGDASVQRHHSAGGPTTLSSRRRFAASKIGPILQAGSHSTAFSID